MFGIRFALDERRNEVGILAVVHATELWLLEDGEWVLCEGPCSLDQAMANAPTL